MTPNTNDGTQAAPYLRCDMSLGTMVELPVFSPAADFARKSTEEQYMQLKQSGFQGAQGGDVKLLRKLGMGATGGGRINKGGEAAEFAKRWVDEGLDCATVHVGWGMEDENELLGLAEEILRATEEFKFPIYIETHRATITQDQWRTVQMLKRFPGLRINGDFSHWYTGLEMVYGNWEQKLSFIEPVFERVRFIHGRIGNSGCMQVDIGDGTNRPHVEHFKELWTRSFMGFLRSAKPGDFICFAPELLVPRINYARVFPNEKGELIEEGDRWTQALLYMKIARECFVEAQARLAKK